MGSKTSLKKLMNLTAADESPPLSSDQVCLILEASAKAGVSTLSFAGLHVTFGTSVEHGPWATQHQPAGIPSENILSDTQHREQTQQAIEAQEIQMRERQMAELLITDPEAYERMLRDGDLSDGMDTADDGDESGE